MRCEIPVLRRCCFCIPLRFGLLIAGYVKLILSLLTLMYIGTTIYAVIYYAEYRNNELFFIITIFTFLNSVVDIVFHTIFIIGAHKKNHRMIRMYNRYSIYNITAVIAFFIFNMAMFMNIFIFIFLIKYVIFICLMFIWTILWQLYLMVLVRSEVIKLKNNAQFQFVNNETEAQCSATIQLSNNLDGAENDNDNVTTLDLE